MTTVILDMEIEFSKERETLNATPAEMKWN